MNELKFMLLLFAAVPVFYYTIKFIVWLSERLEK